MSLVGAIEGWERQRGTRSVIKMVDGMLLGHRWLVVAGAVLIQLCLGALYAWSVFTGKLNDPSGDFAFSSAQTQWVFSVGLAVFAVMTVVSGHLVARTGPRAIVILGGLLLGLGYVLAGLFGNSFIAMLMFIGVLGGAGTGLAYVVPIAVGMRWFPDRKGLITGLAVAGFGFGALLWVQLAGNWGGLLESRGVLTTFLIYGILFAVLVHAGGLLMALPPKGWTPSGWIPPEEPGEGQTRSAGGRVEALPGKMLCSPRFYLIWLAFVFSATAGLMLIGVNKLYGRDALFEAGGFADLAAAGAAASTAYAIAFALANGLGRIGWGMISDRAGWRKSVFVMAIAQGVLMFAFYFVGGNLAMLYVMLALTGFNYGGAFALFPLATADTFGSRNVGLNYGLVFTAYGVGGILGPVMAGMFKDAASADAGAGAWMLPFMIAGALSLVAAVLVLRVRPLSLSLGRAGRHGLRGGRADAHERDDAARTVDSQPPIPAVVPVRAEQQLEGESRSRADEVSRRGVDSSSTMAAG